MSNKIKAREDQKKLAARVVFELMNEMQETSERVLRKYVEQLGSNDLLLINSRAANGRAIFLAQNLYSAIEVAIGEAEQKAEQAR